MINSKKNVIVSILMVVVFISLNGCANNRQSPGNEPPKQTTENSVNKETAIMGEFNNMMQKSDVIAEKIIEFSDENIASVSQENASTMIMALEKNQQLYLPKLQEKFADEDSIQKALTKSDRGALTDSYINGIQEKAIKDLLLTTKNNGFKIEIAEGFYYPVIDYSVYKRYRNAVTQDIAAFIDIMAVESDKTPIKDAALMISWSEIVKRAQGQEKFIKDYGNSAKVEDMRQLLKRYSAFAMYGANNTPLFSYDTKQMVSEAKKTYLETAFDANMGSFSKAMNEYLTILNKNDYKLATEVQEYRNKASEEIR